MTHTTALAGFVHRLRASGIELGSTVVADLADAIELIGAARGEDVYWAFRALTVTRHEQIAVFDEAFMEYFGQGDREGMAIVSRTEPRTWSIHGGDASEGDGSEADEVTSYAGASTIERLRHRDFAELDESEEAEVRALIARMAWSPALTRSRRRRSATGGDRPDLRRSLRRAVGPAGDLMELARTERRLRRRPLILIADVSGSMERYSEMLLYFAHAARSRFGHMEAFVFSTRLTRVTRELRRRRPSEAIAQVAEAVHDWSGGTKIGAAIQTFNRTWSRRVARGGPIVLIISDGWDRGEPDLLAEEMRRLSMTVHRVVWLNPLAGRDGFAPETRGMKAALPHVDDLLAAGTLSDLETLVRLLESVPARKVA